MSVLGVILRKEFRQFFANSFMPRICVAFPILIMLLMPLVADMDVRHVGVTMVDNDHSVFSQQLASRIAASDYLLLQGYTADYSEALAAVEKGDADVIVEIPAGFQKSLLNGRPLSLNISANSVNATKGQMGLRYTQSVVADQLGQTLAQFASAAGAVASGASPQVKLTTLNLYNPTLNYKYFMIPALMIMLIIMICGFLPALNIVSEKETGTIEQVNVSPISQLTFTLGKTIPYVIIGMVVLTLAIIIAGLVYRLWPAGNVLTIYAGAMLFVVVMASLAMLVANFSQNMQQTMFVMFFFVLVFILMSGLLTPVSSMPVWAQRLSLIIPPRHFVDILRTTYLRGSSIADQWQSFAILAAFAVAFVVAAVTTYRKRS